MTQSERHSKRVYVHVCLTKCVDIAVSQHMRESSRLLLNCSAYGPMPQRRLRRRAVNPGVFSTRSERPELDHTASTETITRSHHHHLHTILHLTVVCGVRLFLVNQFSTTRVSLFISDFWSMCQIRASQRKCAHFAHRISPNAHST